MDGKDGVKVLLVGESPREFFASRQLFEWNGCECQFCKSGWEVAELLKSREFDIVLSGHKIAHESGHQLAALLLGSRASLFYSLPVGNGFKWITVLRFGKGVSGTPTLTAAELIYELHRLVQQIKADVTVISP